jgi:O-antigen chain-terminating methyltransferase
MAEQRGLHRVEILRLHPYGVEAMIPQDGTEMAARVNHFFYGPQDYAVIGYKV